MAQSSKILDTDQRAFTSTKIGSKIALDTNISGPLSAFGELSTAEANPVVQFDALFGLTSAALEIFTGTATGSVTLEYATSGTQFLCQSGTDFAGYGLVRSKRTVRYRPGQGARMRFTAAFNTATALTLQGAGGINLGTELSFRYDGTDFGVFRRTGGRPEIQYFDINTATGNQTLTFTLNDVAFSVSTTGADPTTVAYQVAQATDTFTGWDVYSNQARVTFIATAVGDKTGTFSATTTGTFSGSYSEISAGRANVDTFVTQSSWNINTCQTTGTDTFVLDPTKGNVYEISFQYLGYGAIVYSVENPETGKLLPVHQEKYANANVAPHLNNPIFKLGWFASNAGNTSNISVRGGSAAGFVDGKIRPFRNPIGHLNSKTSVDTDLTNILSIRVRAETFSLINLLEVFPEIVTVAVDGTKPAEIQIHVNPSVSGTQDWQYHDESNSVVEFDVAGDVISGGTEIYAAGVGKADTLQINLKELDVVLLRGDVLAVGVRATSGTTDATVGITWLED